MGNLSCNFRKNMTKGIKRVENSERNCTELCSHCRRLACSRWPCKWTCMCCSYTNWSVQWNKITLLASLIAKRQTVYCSKLNLCTILHARKYINAQQSRYEDHLPGFNYFFFIFYTQCPSSKRPTFETVFKTLLDRTNCGLKSHISQYFKYFFRYLLICYKFKGKIVKWRVLF